MGTPKAPDTNKMANCSCFQHDDEWAWHLEAASGLIIATDGGQGYENEKDCQTIADSVV
jgi:Domain of unknown function (DUF1508)